MKKTESMRSILAEAFNAAYNDECVQKIISEYQTIPMLMSAEETAFSKLIGKSKAKKLKSMVDFALSVYKIDENDDIFIRSPNIVYSLVRPELEFLNVEKMLVLGLSVKKQLILKECISIGTINSTIAEPREIYHKLLRRSGIAACIVVHNHPSGDPNPSNDDRDQYGRMIAAGDILGVPCIDHVIVGHSSFYSFKEGRIQSA